MFAGLVCMCVSAALLHVSLPDHAQLVDMHYDVTTFHRLIIANTAWKH